MARFIWNSFLHHYTDLIHFAHAHLGDGLLDAYGADASAIIYSIVETAKLNDTNPFPYLEYPFEKLSNINITSKKEVMKLMPWNKDLPASCRNPSNQETSTCTI